MENSQEGRFFVENKPEKKRIKPDDPVFVVDASLLEELPEDMRAALAGLYSEREQRRARERRELEREYQSDQAFTLVAEDGLWEEIESWWLDHAKAAAERTWYSVDTQARTYVYDKEGREYSLTSLPNRPTVYQFYNDLYGIEAARVCQPEPVDILVNHRDREHPFQLYGDYEDFIQGIEHETSFIYMGSFWAPSSGFLTSRYNAMVNIGGFCIDIDRVDDEKGQHFGANWVMQSLLRVFEKHPATRPNYLMLTGTGIHLWYVFGKQIPLLSAKPRKGRKASPRRNKYTHLLKLIYSWFDDVLPPNLFHVDVPCGTLNHAFRAPGSPSKNHYPTRLFAYGGRERAMIDPLDLSDFFGGDLQPYDVEDWSQEDYRRIQEEREECGDGRQAAASVKQVAYIERLHAMGCLDDDVLTAVASMTIADADAAIKTAETVFTKRGQHAENGGFIHTTTGRMVARKPRARGLYDNTLLRMQTETPAGSRYWALFGLAGLGWNCGISKHQVKHDMLGLLETKWARKLSRDGKPLSREDVNAAMRGYNELGALRSREQLELLLKWSYAPPAKRNGRKQAEHLAKVARPIRKAFIEAGRDDVVGGGRPTKADQIRVYAVEHPELSNRKIAEDLGVSRNTVNKWLKSK